jgi:tetratricopeptide (TPR) repeat protein
VSAAKGSSSGGGSHAQIASSAVTDDRARFGARMLAFAGLWFLLSGLLLALSLVVVVLVAFAVLLLASAAVGGVWLVRHFAVEEKLSTGLVWAGHAVERLWRRVHPLGGRRHMRRLGARARKMAAGAPGRANALLASGLRSYAVAVYRLNGLTSQLLRDTGRLGPVGRSRQALRLNELGAQLRRRGEHEQAAEQHREALEILRDLGDEQAEALTLNNLALALAQGGAEAEAVQHLEQARVVLHELGDEQHEARVIANLGIVYRRQGNTEEAVSLLHEALDRLPPASPAYRQVEEELQRAS